MDTKTLDSIKEDCYNVLHNNEKLLAPLKNSTVVVTGGTGFMGTWLTALITYLNDEHSFNIETILLARNIDKFKLAHPQFNGRKDIKFITRDVRQIVELPAETSWLIHCAATPDNRFHASNPLETMNIIAYGTHAVLRAAERCSHLKMMLNVSSGLVYGGQPLEISHLSEAYNGAPKSNTVSSAYAEAKRYAETLCSAARSQARIPVVTVRPFAFIGPYQGLETPWALNNFMYDALSGNPIRVLGDGETVRSYLYGSDMAFWMLRILTAGQSGEIYNLGSDEAISLRSLAEMIVEEVSPKPEIQMRNSSSTHLHLSRFVPDISFAKINLQLTVSMSLLKSIQRTMLWNKLNYDLKS